MNDRGLDRKLKTRKTCFLTVYADASLLGTKSRIIDNGDVTVCIRVQLTEKQLFHTH